MHVLAPYVCIFEKLGQTVLGQGVSIKTLHNLQIGVELGCLWFPGSILSPSCSYILVCCCATKEYHKDCFDHCIFSTYRFFFNILWNTSSTFLLGTETKLTEQEDFCCFSINLASEWSDANIFNKLKMVLRNWFVPLMPWCVLFLHVI